ncbi:ABC transporter permease [Clostridium sp. B9]|uniref:ABC transporter permease n=1 Tax=Clostridium sp. B9 TaxID=3423224 RepID=UPI003D2EC7AC
MNRLIKAELLKLTKNKVFRVLCGACIILAFMSIFAASDIMTGIMEEAMSAMSDEQQAQMIEQLAMANNEVVVTGRIGFSLPKSNSPIDIYYVSFGVGVIEILIGILVGGFLAKEYTEGTMKNILAYGKSRNKFYLSKFLAMVIGVVIFTLILTLVAFLGTGIMNGFSGIELSQIGGMVVTFLSSVMASAAVISLMMIIGTLVKGNGATIGISVVLFVLVPTIIGVFYGTNSTFDAIYEMTPYYNNALAISQNAEISDILRSMGVSIVTILSGLFIGSRIFNKQDIK